MSEKSNIISIFDGSENKKKGAQKKKEGEGENSPISPPLEPRLNSVDKTKLSSLEAIF